MTIRFDSEQDEWDEKSPEYKDFYQKAAMHLMGHGPHPGQYKGPPEDQTAELAQQRLQEQGPAPDLPPAGPVPPQESVDQPSQQKKGKGGGKPPSGTTPAALGAQAVKPEAPEGNF